MNLDIPPAVVIDNGSDHIKAGFAKHGLPCTEFPCVVGRYKNICIMVGMEMREAYVGYEVRKREGLLRNKIPMEHGIVTNWDDMEQVWHHTFYRELCVEPEEQPLLLTETQFNPKQNQEKTIQIMFETFNTQALYLCSTAKLSLYGAGRTTGIVLESGHDVSHTVPILHSHVLPHATHTLPTTGALLTDYLTESLSQSQGYSLDRDTVHYVKENLTYVSPDYQRDVSVTSAVDEHRYELPDGKIVYLDKELFSCPEVLFQPSLLYSNSRYPAPSSQGIHQLIISSINLCDINIRKHLYTNIVLSGGNSLFPGVRERLEKEISLLVPVATKLGLVAPVERKYLSWIGGANLASLSTFADMCITINEYDNAGPTIIHRRYV